MTTRANCREAGAVRCNKYVVQRRTDWKSADTELLRGRSSELQYKGA